MSSDPQDLRKWFLERISRVLPYPGFHPGSPEAETYRLQVAADLWDDIAQHRGVALEVNLPASLKPDALKGELEEALTRSGIPVSQPDAEDAPTLLLTGDLRRLGRLCLYRVSLTAVQGFLRPRPEGFLTLAACATWSADRLNVAGATEVATRVRAEARQLTKQLLSDLKHKP